jgi:ribosomal protein S18 acetylase RimI-like enzyme
VLTVSHGLDAPALAAVRALEQEVVAHDGGRLKLEPGVLQGGDIDTAQWWEGDRLLGFAGLYAFGAPTAEIAGMVAPAARRRRIGTALLDALLPRCRQRGCTQALLVTPAATPASRAFALSRGGTLDHSEHFLVLGETPDGTPRDPRVTMRTATLADLETVRGLLRAGFDWEPPTDLLDRDGDATRIVELDGVAVGTLRVSRRDGWAGIYGFAVEPGHQGQGIGRDVLARTCRALRDEGVARVTLEVETENANALRLYTSTGFVREAGEDYWKLPLATSG